MIEAHARSSRHAHLEAGAMQRFELTLHQDPHGHRVGRQVENADRNLRIPRRGAPTPIRTEYP
jgi:hypothetical protein